MLTLDLSRVTGVLMSDGWHEFPAGSLRVDKAIARIAPAPGAPATAVSQQHLEGLFGSFRSDNAEYVVPFTAILAFRQTP